MSEKGLGRGLSALFGSENVSDSSGIISSIPIIKIHPNSSQPRREFDEAALSALSESIKENGLITPIAVRQIDGTDGEYQIIAGERRWRASRMAGLAEIPAIVIAADDKQTLELALIENLQREDLNPFEEAEGYRALMEDFGLTQDAVAKQVGKSRSAVANSLRLLGIPDALKQLVRDGKLTAGHARALIPLESEKLMLDTAKSVIDNDLNVRQTETLVNKLIRDTRRKSRDNDRSLSIDYAAELAASLTKTLGRRVKIVHGKNKGRIELEYYGLDDLENVRKFLEESVSSFGRQ